MRLIFTFYLHLVLVALLLRQLLVLAVSVGLSKGETTWAYWLVLRRKTHLPNGWAAVWKASWVSWRFDVAHLATAVGVREAIGLVSYQVGWTGRGSRLPESVEMNRWWTIWVRGGHTVGSAMVGRWIGILGLIHRFLGYILRCCWKVAKFCLLAHVDGLLVIHALVIPSISATHCASIASTPWILPGNISVGCVRVRGLHKLLLILTLMILLLRISIIFVSIR